MNGSDSKLPRALFFILLFFASVLFLALLKIMDDFFKPLTLAVLLAFVFYPPIKKLNTSAKLPWWLSTFVFYTLFFVLLFLIVTVLSSSFKAILSSAPKYQEKLQSLLSSVSSSPSMQPDSKLYTLLDFNEENSLLNNLFQQLNLIDFIKELALTFTSSIVSFTKSLFLVILLSVFLLSEFKSTKLKVSLAFKAENQEKIINAVQKIISETTRYAFLKFILSAVTGLLIFLGCFTAGIDFPLVWGFTAFCFNFIPTFGAIASSAIIILFSVISLYPSVLAVCLLAVWVCGINFVLGTFIEPKITGDNLGLSPFVILVSLSLASWLWGILGMFLAVPLMVIIKIICENITVLKPAAVLLGK